jgi:hypothetical protein
VSNPSFVSSPVPSCFLNLIRSAFTLQVPASPHFLTFPNTPCLHLASLSRSLFERRQHPSSDEPIPPSTHSNSVRCIARSSFFSLDLSRFWSLHTFLSLYLLVSSISPFNPPSTISSLVVLSPILSSIHLLPFQAVLDLCRCLHVLLRHPTLA